MNGERMEMRYIACVHGSTVDGHFGDMTSIVGGSICFARDLWRASRDDMSSSSVVTARGSFPLLLARRIYQYLVIKVTLDDSTLRWLVQG
jgi:hypothetical protein